MNNINNKDNNNKEDKINNFLIKDTNINDDKNNDITSCPEQKKIESEHFNNNGMINKILKRKSGFKIYELLLFAFLIIVISVFLTILVIYETNIVSSISKDNIKENDDLSEFKEVYDLITDSYYEKVDKEKLIDGAIDGMLSSLEDPHTSYFTSDETESFNELMNGLYKGIGAEITIDNNNNIIILSVFKNSPAYKSGLKHNDVILEVNNKSTKGLTTTEVVALIKDESKSTTDLKINRDGKILEFNVTKEIVEIESVESKIFNKSGKKIGYLVINNFANNTYEQFKNQIEDMEKDDISGLVIDVRNNSGGYLHSVTSMLEMLLSKGKILYQIQDSKKTYKYTSTTNESRNYPIAVLINKASASASEILAISLKESYGAYVVGTYSYGKGTVQITKDLSSGAMIKYTTQKWLSPNGNWINNEGVEPTHKVELSSEYDKNPTEENDNQLQEAMMLILNK